MNRLLFIQLLKHEMAIRYRRSVLGAVWMVALPLISLALYTFVFGVVLQSKWGATSDNPYVYALAIFTGLTVHGLFAEISERASRVFLENGHLVKKVAVPKIYLLGSRLAAVIVHNAVVWLLVVLFACFITGCDSTFLLLPFVLIPLYLFCMGLGLVLSVLTVYVRDILQLLPGLVLAALFLSPVFYTLDRLPDAVRPLAWLNPLALPMEAARTLLIDHRMYDMKALFLYSVGMLIFAMLAYLLFKRAEQGVADLV